MGWLFVLWLGVQALPHWQALNAPVHENEAVGNLGLFPLVTVGLWDVALVTGHFGSGLQFAAGGRSGPR